MPQLDSASFRSQVFLFTLVFVGRYRVRVKDILPVLNRAVKVRAKKLEMTKGDASRFDSERSKAKSAYSAARATAASSSYGLLSSALATQEELTNNITYNLFNVQRQDVSEEYRNALMETEARKRVLFDLLNDEDQA